MQWLSRSRSTSFTMSFESSTFSVGHRRALLGGGTCQTAFGRQRPSGPRIRRKGVTNVLLFFSTIKAKSTLPSAGSFPRIVLTQTRSFSLYVANYYIILSAQSRARRAHDATNMDFVVTRSPVSRNIELLL